ncbi:hypothetical protein J7L48_09465 [bacterium]|nr:hypothetical protein [bacterium]
MNKEFTKDELLVAEKIVKFFVNHGLTTPAIFYIELNRPLNYIGSQLLVMFEPFIKAFIVGDEYSNFVNFLEKRDSVDILLEMFDTYDKEKRLEVKEKKKKLKKE